MCKQTFFPIRGKYEQKRPLKIKLPVLWKQKSFPYFTTVSSCSSTENTRHQFNLQQSLNEKLMAVIRQTQVEHIRSTTLSDTNDVKISGERISRVSKEIEGRVYRKKLSLVESNWEWIKKCVFKIERDSYERIFFGTTRKLFREFYTQSQESDRDSFQNDLQVNAIEVENMMTHTVIFERTSLHHMVKKVHKEIPFCKLGTPSGWQKKTCSRNQRQFRRENDHAAMEADRFLLAHQQVPSKSNSASLSNIIHKVSTVETFIYNNANFRRKVVSVWIAWRPLRYKFQKS